MTLRATPRPSFGHVGQWDNWSMKKSRSAVLERPPVLSLDQVSDLLDVDKWTLHRWIKAGTLRAEKQPATVITFDEVARVLASRGQLG